MRVAGIVVLLAIPATAIVLAVSCKGAPEPAWTGRDLAEAAAPAPLLLDRMEATWELPAGTGPDLAARTTWDLTAWMPSGADEDDHEDEAEAAVSAWSKTPLPFQLPPGERRFAPEGMRVFVEGIEAVFFAGSSRPPGRRLWRVRGPFLEISGPLPASVRLEHPGLLDPVAALEWPLAQAKGTPVEAFVRRSVAIGKDSREGLFLPAPSRATWAGVTIPPGARFTAWLGLAPTPLASRSDGAEVVLVLVGPQGEVELGRTTVEPVERFTPWSVDLSAHGGATGDLVIRTLPGAAAEDDYVFVGSPVVAAASGDDVRRVVVIGIDTLRPDHMGMYGYEHETTPELDAWAKDAVVFDRAWTSAPRTRPSFRSATTGRDPLEAVCATNIGAVFDAEGFATAGIVANVHLNPRFDFHEGFDWWHLDGEAKVDAQVEMAKAWLTSVADRDAYLFLHVMDPHIFYVAPPPYGGMFTSTLEPLPDDQKVPPRFNRANVYRWMQRGKLTDLQKQHIVARYDGEVAYMDHHVGSFLAWLDTLPGRTVVVLHSDHGEEFWEHGGFEHNHTLYDDTTRGVLVVKPPGGAGREGARSDALATLVDIAPTLYDLAGIEEPPPTDGESLVPALRGEPTDADRAIPIGYLQYDAERWGVVWRDHKYVIHTGSGDEELYDLRADPGETRNLAGSVDTTPWWQQVEATHGVAVGHGWRVKLELGDCQEARITLPQPATQAGVLDPESVSRNPVNQEWGEVPPVLPAEVGEVHLEDDGRTVRIVGGPKGRGFAYVLFGEAPVDLAGASVTIDGEAAPIERAGAVRVGASTLGLRPGIVVVPPPTELERMEACLTMGQGSDAELAELAALGYIDAKAPQRITRGGGRPPVLPADQRCSAGSAPAEGADSD